MYLGAHMSIAGGIHLACERGREVGCNVIQVFSKNQRQWNAKPLSADDIKLFRAATRKHKIRTAFAHGTYLINLASSDRGLWSKSGNAFVEELERCEELGLKFLITHPGSAGDKGETVAIRNMIRGLNDIHRRSRGFKTKVLLETTAGQGTTVGWRFEHMAAIRDGLKDPERIGFCFDTCHIFAAGYDIRTSAGYDGVMEKKRKKMIDAGVPLVFGHSLETLIGGQTGAGFVIIDLYEDWWSDDETLLNKFSPTTFVTRASKSGV